MSRFVRPQPHGPWAVGVLDVVGTTLWVTGSIESCFPSALIQLQALEPLGEPHFLQAWPLYALDGVRATDDGQHAVVLAADCPECIAPMPAAWVFPASGDSAPVVVPLPQLPLEPFGAYPSGVLRNQVAAAMPFVLVGGANAVHLFDSQGLEDTIYPLTLELAPMDAAAEVAWMRDGDAWVTGRLATDVRPDDAYQLTQVAYGSTGLESRGSLLLRSPVRRVVQSETFVAAATDHSVVIIAPACTP